MRRAGKLPQPVSPYLRKHYKKGKDQQEASSETPSRPAALTGSANLALEAGSSAPPPLLRSPRAENIYGY